MPPTFRPTAQGDLASFRLSAAVLLTRGRGADLEVFLVRRSPKLKAFADMWALPGGVVDAVDGDPLLGDLDVYRRCGLRELFEETGVAGPGMREVLGALAPERRLALRRALAEAAHRGDADTARAAEAEWAQLVADASRPFDGLEPFCWTTTPAFAARRYRALYLHVELPDGEEPSVLRGELVDGGFQRPATVRERWLADEWRLVPPVVFLMERLHALRNDLAAAKREAAEIGEAVDRGALHVVSPAPGILVAPLRTPTIPPATTTNCYVVGRERAYVVDPATYDEHERDRLFRFLDAAAALDLELAGVLVTHHHPDHVGSVQAVAERYSLPVLAHPLTLERLPEPPRDPRPLADGDRIELGAGPDGGVGWHLAALHTPGHDRGHLVFRESRHGAVIAGDLVSTLSTIVIDPPEGHLATYLASLERVRAARPGQLLPAHGPVAPDGGRLLRVYVEHRRQREASLVRALEERGAATVQQLVPRVYADVDASAHGLAARSLVAGLEKLAEEGRATERDGRWSLGGTLSA